MPDHAAATDDEATLAIVRISREESALRAIWWGAYERTEPVLAEIIAERLGRDPQELAIGVQAVTLNAALRITTEDLAAAAEDGLARLSEAARAATHGLLGDALARGGQPITELQ